MARKNTMANVFLSIDMRGGDKEQCWPWKGKLNAKDERPYITIAGKRRPAYAVVLELTSGPAAKGLVALHSCDNRICCNPHHLTWGTHDRNMREMVERDRHGLNKTVVRAILRLREEGRTQSSVAKRYGISREAISASESGRSGKSRHGSKAGAGLGSKEGHEEGTDNEQVDEEISNAND